MLQYTRVCRDVALVRAPSPSPPSAPLRTRPHPPDPCYCCDLMKCYARSPAITFPLHRLTPHPPRLSWRDSGTPFLPDCDPRGCRFRFGGVLPRVSRRCREYSPIASTPSRVSPFVPQPHGRVAGVPCCRSGSRTVGPSAGNSFSSSSSNSSSSSSSSNSSSNNKPLRRRARPGRVRTTATAAPAAGYRRARRRPRAGGPRRSHRCKVGKHPWQVTRPCRRRYCQRSRRIRESGRHRPAAAAPTATSRPRRRR